ncbi:MAG: hypothetical protein ABIU29_10785 [Chthoniobacterales bacterium]
MQARKIFSFVSANLAFAFLFVLALSVAPQWHERLHKDAASSQHQCAVTLIATGNYQQSDAPVLVAPPRPFVHFSTLPALRPVWVAAPFLGAAIFEHAPPARS